MLDFFRTHHKIGMALLLVATLGLGFFGISNFSDFFGPGASVLAKVNSNKITHDELDNEVREQHDAALKEAEDKNIAFDESQHSSPQYRQAIFDGMIVRLILGDEMQRQHMALTVSDEAVRRAEMSIPAIAALRKPDGSIDIDRYRQLLASRGMTPTQYDEQVRNTLAAGQLQQLPDAIINSAFVPKAVAQHLTSLLTQQRSVQELVLRADSYAAQVQVSDAQAQAYYNAHRSEFTQPATAQIQYVVLSPQTVAASLPASDAATVQSLLTKYEGVGDEAFSTIVNKNPQTLQRVADKFKLTLQTATVTPQPNPGLSPAAPLNNAKFLAFVFASDSLNQHNSTPAIDVGNSTMIAARVTHYQPAGTPEFATIKDAVRQKMVAQQARSLMLRDGEAKLADLKKTKSAEGFSPEQKVIRLVLMQSGALPPEVIHAIYRASAKNLPAYTGIDLGSGYVIFRINAVSDAPVDASQMAAASQQIALNILLPSSVDAQTRAYIDALRARAKVKLYGSSAASSKQQGANQ